MCARGDKIKQLVPIAAELSYDGVACWERRPIDRCIAKLVEALNAGDVYTTASCCGHGEEPGEIVLQDGRRLVVLADFTSAKPDPISIAILRALRGMPPMPNE